MTKAEWIGLGIAGVAAGGLVFLATRGGVSAPSSGTTTAAAGSGSNTTPASGNTATSEVATLQQEVNSAYATVKANSDTISELQTQLYQANKNLAALLVSAQSAGISLSELKSQVSGLS